MDDKSRQGRRLFDELDQTNAFNEILLAGRISGVKKNMDIPSGGVLGLLRIVLKPIVDFIERVLFRNAYEVSTLYKTHREAFSFRPRKLPGGLEYQVFWMPYRLRKRLTTPMMWVRSNNGTIKKATLIVTAFNDKIKYQDCVEIYNVDDVPVQTALPSIPFRDLKFNGGLVMTPYDTIRVRVVELLATKGEEINIDSDKSDMFMPFDRLEVAMGLEKGDVEKWGEHFNLEFLESEIKEERIRILGESYFSPYPISLLKRRLSEAGWAVRIIFWSRNLIFAKHLTNRLGVYLKEHEEFKVWEREKEKEEKDHGGFT